MIALRLNGSDYSRFVSASVTLSLDSICNDFIFNATSINGFPPAKEGDLIEVIVDGEKVTTGRIQEVNGSESEGSHVVSYTGRDLTADLVDSQINVIDDIRANDSLTLKKIIEKIITHIGSPLKVVDLVEPEVFNKAEDILKPEVGESAFEFCLKYALKRSCLLTSDENGNVLIVRAGVTDSGGLIQWLKKSNSNNVIAHTWAINGSRIFNKYIVRGQQSPLALNFTDGADAKSIEDQNGGAVDNNVQGGRQRVKVEAESYSDEQLRDRAEWTRQLAKAKATKYTATVKGYRTQKGKLWTTNTTASIKATSPDIFRYMLINRVIFATSEGSNTSTIEFVEKDVYQLAANISKQKPIGSLNDAFKSVG